MNVITNLLKCMTNKLSKIWGFHGGEVSIVVLWERIGDDMVHLNVVTTYKTTIDIFTGVRISHPHFIQAPYLLRYSRLVTSNHWLNETEKPWMQIKTLRIYPEDGCDMSHRNVGNHLRDYMAPQRWRSQSTSSIHILQLLFHTASYPVGTGGFFPRG
jgi:hypothetical protein